MRADTLLGPLSNILESPEVEVSLIRFVNIRAKGRWKNDFGEVIFLVYLHKPKRVD